MQALLIICFGTALVLAGAYRLYNGYETEEFTTSLVAWTGIIIGALITLFGFGKRVSDRVAKPERDLSEHGHAEIRALVQSMGVVATADKKIRDREVEAIARIHEEMLGIGISGEEVREILSEFGPDFDIASRLKRDREKISPLMKRVIIQSCHMVMVSDLEVVKPEESRIFEVGDALGFTKDDVQDLIAKAGT